MREISCEESVELGAEVALGVAGAEDRAAVLSHVEHCASCATSLQSMTDVADSLATAVPPATPPAGFEARVLGAITKAAAPVRRPTPWERLRARPVALAAAVAVASALGAGGWLVAESTSGPPGSVISAILVSHRTAVGQVVVVPGTDPWISMTVHARATSTLVRCDVEADNGTVRTLGTFTVVDGYGYWAAPLPHGTSVRAAMLVMPNGKLLATARFASR